MVPVYEGMAKIYDTLMQGVNYDHWADYIEEILSQFDTSPKTVVDLACGTGNTTFPFAARGYQVTGVDLSDSMLERARVKAAKQGYSDIQFLQQDMRELNLPTAVDLVTCLYDSINYLPSTAALAQTARQVFSALTPGGLFIFDANSAYKLSSIPDTTAFFEHEDMCLVWENRYDAETRVWEARFTGFLQQDDGLWERFKEVHRETAFTSEEYSDSLTKAGFEILAEYTAFSFSPPATDTSRIYYVARRPIP